MLRQAVIAAFTALVLSGCASGPHVSPSEATDLEQGMPPDGTARVYVYAYHNAIVSFRLSVNGIVVGDFGPGEAIAMDLVPGHYSALLQAKTVWGGFSVSLPSQFDVEAGQKLYLAESYYSRPTMVGGAAGYAVESAVEGALDGNNDPNHPIGDYFEVRTHTDEVEDKDFIAPDPSAIARINGRH